MDQILDYW